MSQLKKKLQEQSRIARLKEQTDKQVEKLNTEIRVSLFVCDKMIEADGHL